MDFLSLFHSFTIFIKTFKNCYLFYLFCCVLYLYFQMFWYTCACELVIKRRTFCLFLRSLSMALEEFTGNVKRWKKLLMMLAEVCLHFILYLNYVDLCHQLISIDLELVLSIVTFFSREPLVPCRVVLYLSSVALTLLFIYIFVYHMIMVFTHRCDTLICHFISFLWLVVKLQVVWIL